MAKKIDLNGLDHFKEKENAMIASEYSSSKTYAVGDYVYHNGTLYKCTTAITTAEAWTSGHWTAAKLADDCSGLMTAITQNGSLTTQSVQNALSSSGYGKGDWTKNGNVVEFVSAQSGYNYALQPFAVSEGDIVQIDFNAKSGESIFFVNENNNAFDYVSSITTSRGAYKSDFITIPSGVSHLLLTKYGSYDAYINAIVQKTDKTLTLENVAAEAAVVGSKIEALTNNVLNKIFQFLPCQFIGNAYINGSGTVEDSSRAIASLRRIIFSTPANVKIYSTDSNIGFWYAIEGSTTVYTVDNIELYNQNIYLNAYKKDNTAFTISDLNKIFAVTTLEAYEQYIKDNYIVFEQSNFFPDYGSDIFRYGMYTTENQLGFAKRQESYNRITAKPCISPKDVRVYAGKYETDNSVTVVVNGVETVASNGEYVPVPKNTPFQVGFITGSTSAANSKSNSCFCIVDGVGFGRYINQTLTSATTTRCDCAFIADDKYFMIANDVYGDVYSVMKDDAFIVEDQQLDHTSGHANSCNYVDGKVYISDWDSNNIIHVFSVDTTENTLTYVKDITLPQTTYGDTEYYVRSGEQEIVFVGWKTGDSSTEINTIVYGLYVYNGSTYVLSWIKEAIRPTVLQGITVVGNKIYIVNCHDASESYHTIGFNVLNMETGLTESYPASGNITGVECEAIIPLEKNIFIAVSSKGITYLITFPD